MNCLPFWSTWPPLDLCILEIRAAFDFSSVLLFYIFSVRFCLSFFLEILYFISNFHIQWSHLHIAMRCFNVAYWQETFISLILWDTHEYGTSSWSAMVQMLCQSSHHSNHKKIEIMNLLLRCLSQYHPWSTYVPQLITENSKTMLKKEIWYDYN